MTFIIKKEKDVLLSGGGGGSSKKVFSRKFCWICAATLPKIKVIEKTSLKTRYKQFSIVSDTVKKLGNAKF